MGLVLKHSHSLNTERIRIWDSIYREQKKRWNGLPSKLAETTLKFIYYNKKIDFITDIAGGYGRDSIYFLKYGYRIINIESSEAALAILETDYRTSYSDLNLAIIRGDATESAIYETIEFENQLLFCNYFLHLLDLEELHSLLQIISLRFKSGTLFSFNLISKKDFRYQGVQTEEIEKDIYWSFWNKEDITNLISNYPFSILFWEEEIEIEYINKKFDKVYTHFIIVEIK